MPQHIFPEETDRVTIDVRVNQKPISDRISVMRIKTTNALDAIPRAEIVLADGDPVAADFPLSASGAFDPGKQIEIRVGHDGRNAEIFRGVILTVGIGLDSEGASCLTLGCAAGAIRATLSRSMALFADTTDADAMRGVLEQSGLSHEVAATNAIHGQIAQADMSDWDFVLERARANGLLVRVEDTKVIVGAPVLDPPKIGAEFGTNIFDMDLDLDATHQWASVDVSAWDPAKQTRVSAASKEPRLAEHGEISGKTLSKVLDLGAEAVRHSAAVPAAALTALANATLLESRLARITGSVTMPGHAGLDPGDNIALEGLGKVFDGAGFVNGVTQFLAGGEWRMTVEIGRPPMARSHRQPASNTSPDLCIATIIETGGEASALGRIRVRPSHMPQDSPGLWARLAGPYASAEAGMHFLPEIGDEVVIGFLGGAADAPTILGALQSPARPGPLGSDPANRQKAIVTRAGHAIRFDDDTHALSITTAAGQTVALNDAEKTVTLTDLTYNTVTLSQDGIAMTSPGDIAIHADGTVAISGTLGVTVETTSDARLKGNNVAVEGDMGVDIVGGASADLHSGGQTTVRGTMVMIN